MLEERGNTRRLARPPRPQDPSRLREGRTVLGESTGRGRAGRAQQTAYLSRWFPTTTSFSSTIFGWRRRRSSVISRRLLMGTPAGRPATQQPHPCTQGPLGPDLASATPSPAHKGPCSQNWPHEPPPLHTRSPTTRPATQVPPTLHTRTFVTRPSLNNPHPCRQGLLQPDLQLSNHKPCTQGSLGPNLASAIPTTTGKDP